MTATCFIIRNGAPSPLDIEAEQSILDALLQQEDDITDDPPPPLIKKFGTAIAVAYAAATPALAESFPCAHRRHCPFCLYERGKNGKRLSVGRIICTGDCC